LEQRADRELAGNGTTRNEAHHLGVPVDAKHRLRVGIRQEAADDQTLGLDRQSNLAPSCHCLHLPRSSPAAPAGVAGDDALQWASTSPSGTASRSTTTPASTAAAQRRSSRASSASSSWISRATGTRRAACSPTSLEHRRPPTS